MISVSGEREFRCLALKKKSLLARCASMWRWEKRVVRGESKIERMVRRPPVVAVTVTGDTWERV